MIGVPIRQAAGPMLGLPRDLRFEGVIFIEVGIWIFVLHCILPDAFDRRHQYESLPHPLLEFDDISGCQRAHAVFYLTSGNERIVVANQDLLFFISALEHLITRYFMIYT